MAKFEAAIGRYVWLEIQGVEYRVYFEEAGQGIPLICQHTAGSGTDTDLHLKLEPGFVTRDDKTRLRAVSGLILSFQFGFSTPGLPAV